MGENANEGAQGDWQLAAFLEWLAVGCTGRCVKNLRGRGGHPAGVLQKPAQLTGTPSVDRMCHKPLPSAVSSHASAASPFAADRIASPAAAAASPGQG